MNEPLKAANELSCSDPIDCVEMGNPDKRMAIVFLHGLFSGPHHWQSIMEDLSDDYRVLSPQLPVDRQPGRRATGAKTITQLTDFLDRLVNERKLDQFVLCGNSLGGLIAMDYCLRYPNRVAGLILAGSAGLYERSLTSGSVPRPNRDFVRSMASDIIYNRELVTESLVDEWLEAAQDRDYARFVLRISKATRDHQLENELHRLKLPTMIVWGRNDKITPPSVGENFQSHLPHSQLAFIEECGHAPNLEKPHVFSALISRFAPQCFASRSAPTSADLSVAAPVSH